MYPIIPSMVLNLYMDLFNSKNIEKWPEINKELLIETRINLPIQVQGKLITTINTEKGYIENEILNSIYKLNKVKNKIQNRKVIKVINVQDKIINIIVD